ncbi:ligand-binding sensor domain-containing protein [Thalassotalea atypica]|uniref:ligand-binding sensor domain-containing protein n=1 Tax=Thalassotalea atypica TaxID=2054316 RepID=UPI002573635A|nr:triple tyrosine motif-containing protein [Thalassotalea atypica]
MALKIISLIKKAQQISYNAKSWGKVLSALPFLLFFSIFQTSANNSNSIEILSDVNDIYQDKSGYVWIAGQHGLARFDAENQINFSNNNKHWPLPFSWAHQVTPFNDHLLVSTQVHGLFIFDISNGKTEQIQLPSDIKTTYFATYFENNIYFESNDSLYAYNVQEASTKLVAENLFVRGILKNEEHIYFINNSNIQTLNDGELTTIFTGSIDAYASTVDSLIVTDSENIYLVKESKIAASKSIDTPISSLASAKHSNSVFALTKQGNIQQFSANDLIEITHNFPNFSVNKVKKMYHDDSGVLWIASNKGVHRLVESNVKNHPKIFDVRHNANEIVLVEDELIIATYGDGLHTMDGTSNFIHPNVNDSFTENGKRAMTVLMKGEQMLLGTFDGVWTYNKNQVNAKKLSFENNDNIVLKLVTDNDKLYIGTNRAGLKIYDLKMQKITHHIDRNNGLKNEEVIDILPLHNGDVWLATSNNVEIYNQHSNEIQQTGVSIPNKVISLNLVNNKVYATTKGSGILVFSLRGELLSRFAEGIDFSHGRLLEGELWIPAKPGIYRLEPENNQLSLVPGSEDYTFSSAPLKSKENIYAWHSGGLFEIKNYNNEIYHANIKVSLANVSGRPMLNKADLKLDSSNDVVTLTLASLDHRKSNKKRFQYRINNSTWTNATSNQITLTGLKSGSYDIEIKGTNSLGQWSNNRAFASITVAYPWYWTLQMRVIYLVCLICFIAIAIWLLYLRANSIKKVHLLLENELKNKGKRAVSITRSLNLAQELLTEKKIDEASGIIKQSIEELDSNNLQEEPDCLYGNSLEVALPYFGEYLYQKYHITLNNQLEFDKTKLDYELQANIYKIVYEAVTSALLTSESRHFNVHIQEFKSKLWLTVSDNENCFAHFNSKITFDMAMYYVRQIAEKYNASVNTFDAQEDKGSQLVVSFPLMSLS